MIRILILDDDPTHVRLPAFRKKFPESEIVHVEIVKDAIDKLLNEEWFACFLDHDLGGKVYVESGKDTGWEVAKWLQDNPDHMPKYVFLHSCNSIGRRNMFALLPNAIECPYVWL